LPAKSAAAQARPDTTSGSVNVGQGEPMASFWVLSSGGMVKG